MRIELILKPMWSAGDDKSWIRIPEPLSGLANQETGHRIGIQAQCRGHTQLEITAGDRQDLSPFHEQGNGCGIPGVSSKSLDPH